MIACKEKYERGAAEFQSGWVTARAEMEDASAVNAGKAKAEADRRLHETRASSAQSIARLTARSSAACRPSSPASMISKLCPCALSPTFAIVLPYWNPLERTLGSLLFLSLPQARKSRGSTTASTIWCHCAAKLLLAVSSLLTAAAASVIAVAFSTAWTMTRLGTAKRMWVKTLTNVATALCLPPSLLAVGWESG